MKWDVPTAADHCGHILMGAQGKLPDRVPGDPIPDLPAVFTLDSFHCLAAKVFPVGYTCTFH